LQHPNIAALHTANENFSESADRVDIAIKSSALDSANYHNALAALPPGLRSASVLLGDQNARWQDLTTAQKNNVVALANNKDALKELLPSQKTALTALLQGKKAWDDMSPAQQAAAANLNKISGAWGKLTTAMEPSVMKVIAAGADQVSKAIGPIGDIAKAAVPGITQMVGILGTGLIGFLKGVQPLIAPSMGALNSILVSVTTSLNKGLAPAMVSGMPQFVKMAELVGKVTGGLILLLGEMVRVSAWMITGFTFAVNIFRNDTVLMLKGLLDVTGVAGRMPGPLAAPFRAASVAARRAIDDIEGVHRSVNNLPVSKRINLNVFGSGQWGVFGPGAAPKLGLAAGGARVPGYGGGDRHLYALEGGEAVVPKHLTPAVAPFLKAHGVPGFAAGGVVGSYRNGPLGLGAWDVREYNATASMIEQATAAATFAGMKAAAAAFRRTAGGGNVGAIIAAALGIDRAPMSWAPAEATLVRRESGGNAGAVNPVTVLGQHATGLAQMLPMTFARWALPGYGNIFNGLDNMVASIRYQRAQYGSPYNIPGLMGGGTYYGYDTGAGVLPRGLSLSYNGTGASEYMTRAHAGTGGGGGNTYIINVASTPLARPADIGREVVGAIREHEKRAGKGWRTQ